MSPEAAFTLSSEGLFVLLLSPEAAFALSSEGLAVLSFSSSVLAAPSAPSTPSPGTSPSAVVSSTFSGSTKTVGATTVAITKSLPVIVGATFSGNLTEDILRLVLISILSRSTIIS